MRTLLLHCALTICVMGAVCGLARAADDAQPRNMAIDASFESPLPPWFAERSGASYYAARQTAADAVDGRHVFAIEGWDAKGSKILSGPVNWPANAPLSATVSVRAFGNSSHASFELAIFDAKGAKKLASVGKIDLSGQGQWQTIAAAGVKLAGTPDVCRMGLILAGPERGLRVEVDCVGLFTGPRPGKVVDNDDFAMFEAEELADGAAWKVVEHYPSWYSGTPSGMKMLAGYDPVKPEQNKPATRTLTIRQSGRHTLWVRLLAGPYAGKFTVALRQDDKIVAQKEFAENGEYGQKGYAWVWDCFDADLHPGDVQLELTRPARGASWVTRKIDLFLLTNRDRYEPAIEDLQPAGYMRFTNLSDGVEPFGLYMHVRRHQGPKWYANPGVLTHAGLSEGYYMPTDRDKWLAPSETSPWVKITDYLLAAGGRNNVQIIATRKSHVDGYVREHLRGKLEFATGDDRHIVKTIDIDQNAPRVLLTVAADFAAGQGIKTSLDYIAETEREIEKLPPIKPIQHLAQHMNLAANLSLRADEDDPKVIDREIEIIKKLGFNQTYFFIAPPESAAKFYEQHGLVPRSGGGPSLWSHIKEHSQHHPDIPAMELAAAEFAQKHQAALPNIVRCKLMDEPAGMSYEQIANSALCREKFITWLKDRALTPESLGIKTWEEATPVVWADREKKPELFYYTGLFRLEAFATLARACVAAKNKSLPPSMLTYVNYSPPTGGGTWTERGTDLFMAHRAGGMEMIWTEDWLGYSLGPQHLSDILAICRAAGRPDHRRLGAYCVGQATPALMRMKYYTLAAAGVRDIECYDYGPWYAGIDSWARRFDLYGAIRDCNYELGAIDDALEGAARHPTDIAILYNRTASIWAHADNTAAMNASFTHWALAHAGYDADFIPEEDVESGGLSHYKLLYIDGPQLRKECASAIAAWVEAGGVVFASAGAASRDAFNRPAAILEKTFGVSSKQFEIKAAVNRPKFDLRPLKPLAALAPAPQSPAPAVAFPQLCWSESIEPAAGANVILQTSDGKPACVINRIGKGTAIRVAALPGVSYAHAAVQPPYSMDAYLPRDFPPALRDFIAWPAALAKAGRVASADDPIAEIVRYDAADRAVVFIIDHRAQPTPAFAFTLYDASQFTRAASASGNPVELTRTADGALRITLPMNVADAVVLKR